MGKHPQRLFGFQEKENRKEKRKTRELCISLSVKCNTHVVLFFQEVISTPYIVFTKAKACDWLVTRIRKEITSKNYIRKYLKWSQQKQRKIRTTHGLCEF